MLTLNVSDSLTLELYDSVEALPAAVYQEAKQYEILDAELGGGEQRLLQDLDRLELYARAGQMESFTELKYNLKIGRMLTLDKYQPGQLEFACYVRKANDRQFDTYGEDELIARIAAWSQQGLTQKLIEDTLSDVKKNSLRK